MSYLSKSFCYFTLVLSYMLMGFSLMNMPVENMIVLRMIGFTAIFIVQQNKGYFINDNNKESVKIFITSFVLGVLFNFSTLEPLNADLHPYQYYTTLMIIYHLGEFWLVCTYHTDELKWASFLLYHSNEYVLAFALSQIEFFLEYTYLHQFKSQNLTAYIGLAIMLVGLSMRIIAFYTAKQNFHHIVQYQKKENHVLVTHGIYSICRHPSYSGFFWMSIGG